MTTDVQLSERQLREKEYYNQYAAKHDLETPVDFTPVHGPIRGIERRPWNSYWAIYEMAIDAYKKGAKMLDFGSGPGDNSLRFSEIGYDVEGFDISEANVEVAKKLFKKYKRAERGNFQVASAEKLPYDDQSFDSIVGVDILHHVDIPKSILECKRVLKSGGVALFREPMEVPILESIRNSWLVRKLVPNEKSLELHITEDERKLNRHDFTAIRAIFPNMEVKRYLLFSRFDKFYRKGSDPKPSLLEKLDYFLMRIFPKLQNLGGAVIFILRKE